VTHHAGTGVVAGLAVFAFCGLTGITGLFLVAAAAVTAPLRRRARARRAVHGLAHAVADGVMTPGELQEYGDQLRANLTRPDDDDGLQVRGAA